MEPLQTAPQPARLGVGTIRQIYKGRGFGVYGEVMAIVSYTRANGGFGKRRCFLKALTPR